MPGFTPLRLRRGKLVRSVGWIGNAFLIAQRDAKGGFGLAQLEVVGHIRDCVVGGAKQIRTVGRDLIVRCARSRGKRK